MTQVPLALRVFLTVIGLLPVEVMAQTRIEAPGGVAAQSISNSPINIGISGEVLTETTKALSQEIASSNEARVKAEARAAELAKELGFTKDIVIGFFRILGEQNVPPDQMAIKLGEIAARQRALGTATAAVGAKPGAARDQFGPDSLRLIGRGVVVNQRSGRASATFVLENRSDIGFDTTLESKSITLGTCAGIGVPDVNGLGLARPSGQTEWRNIPASRKITFSISGFTCKDLLTEKSADFAASLLIRVGERIISYPIQADGVLVQVDGT